MTTLQNYLQNLFNRGENSKAELYHMRPKNSNEAKTHSLPKIHKTFTNISKIGLFIGTTGSSLYLVGKYATEFLYPLWNNKLKMKYLHPFNNNLIASKMFHSVCLWMGVNIYHLMSRIYNNHTISTYLKRCSLKTLILDTYSKIAFSIKNFKKRWCNHGVFPWVCHGQYYYDKTRRRNNQTTCKQWHISIHLLVR